jgi:Domain of unknown function (DUF6268)
VSGERVPSSNDMKLRSSLLALALAPALLAQPSATMRPALLASYDFGWSFSSQEDLSRGAARAGEVSVHRFDFSLSSRARLSESTSFAYGLAYATNRLDASAAILPDELSELSLNLGLIHRHSESLTLAAYARPGFYGDFDDLNGDAFNAPLLLTAGWSPSRELTWLFGLNVNAFSDNPVLPILGVRWQFATDWLFNVGFPRSGLTYKASEKLNLAAGVSFQGGSFRVGRDPRATPLSLPVAPGLADTYLDYREVRAGLNLEYDLSETLKLTADVGAVTDRKFDWFDRDYRLDGDTGAYFSLALKGSF